LLLGGGPPCPPPRLPNARGHFMTTLPSASSASRASLPLGSVYFRNVVAVARRSCGLLPLPDCPGKLLLLPWKLDCWPQFCCWNFARSASISVWSSVAN